MEESRAGMSKRTRRSSSPAAPRRSADAPAQRLPAAGLFDALPGDCMIKIVSSLISKPERDTIALTCHKMHSLTIPFRRHFHFEYSTSHGADHSTAESEPSQVDIDAEASGRSQVLESQASMNGSTADADDDNSPQRNWSELPKFLLHIIRTFPDILSITIKGCKRDMATDLPKIDLSSVLLPPHFHNLTSFKISAVDGIDDPFIHLLSLACPSLTHLSLHHCQLLTDAALFSLATHCKELASLKIQCFRDTLTDQGVGRLLLCCTAMTTLCLKGCPQVKGSGFHYGTALTRLDADECGIEREHLARGLQGTTALRTLSLGYIDTSEDLALPISQHCEGLEELNLTENYALDDVGITRIVQGCRRLRILRVNFCVGVTARGWDAVGQAGLNVEELEVRGCDGFCGESLQSIRTGSPSLRSLKLPYVFLPPNPAFLQFLQVRSRVNVEIYDDDQTFNRLVYQRNYTGSPPS